ncbi:ATP-binding protein [Paenibacillus donghaensis]|uniref:nSTAND1 domain-containing NTPase n=1 Tax=Paenibacillus donghaensis TaxID=414771 RepID=UPI0018847E99|nr:ATP-binding protein [Paenibacillus donghaensis]MBE9916841.1 ATP-binding protein [Paenibacillus donghaensis]
MKRETYRIALEADRFVGRVEERSQLSKWLQDKTARSQIFSITGMGGIGKSSLMSQLSRLGKNAGCVCLWLDGRSFTPTPASFLESLSAAASLEQLEQAETGSLRILTKAGPLKRVMLFIDNFEELSLLEGWLLDAFLPKLSSAGVAVLLATRPRLPITWITHPVWGLRMTEFRLAHFTNQEMVDYIQSFGTFPDETVGRLVRLSDGHPLALALSVETAIKDKACGPDKQIISQSISARVLRELASEKLQPMVDVLTVLPEANQEMLSRLTGRTVTTQQFRELAGLSFVRSGTGGLALHDVARMHLLKDFRQREPKRLLELQCSSAQLLYGKFQQADRKRRRGIASQMLMLSKELLSPHRGYADFSGDSIPPLEQPTAADLPNLHKMLEEWCVYSVDPHMNPSYHDFLDELADRFPESIAIVRDSQGQPAGMFIIVLVYYETGLLLQRYFPHELSECFMEEEWKCEPDKADTYFPVLTAATNSMPGYSKEEIIGLLMLDHLSLLGDGSRAILVATNDVLKQQLRGIGFRIRPTATRNCDVSWAEAHILELDLREGNFGEWVLSFFKGSGEMESVMMDVFHALSPGDQERQLRKILLSLHDPVELEKYAGAFPGVGSGIDLQRFMLRLMKISGEAGLTEEYGSLLYAAYWQHAGNSDAAALECSMSRATFYRYLKKAIANFTRVLAAQLQNSAMEPEH